MDNSYWIGGRHAVLAAIRNTNRNIKRLVLDKGLDNLDLNEVSSSQKKFELANKDQIKKLFSDKDFVHQGYAALISPLKTLSLKEFLNSSIEKSLLLPILEDINDPRNLGSILRSCAAFGVKHVMIKDNSVNEKSAYLHKAASGACEKINFVKVSNISTALKVLKKEQFWVYGTDLQSNQFMHKIKLSEERYAVIFGSEQSGIKKLTKENCDSLFKIKMRGEMESLNVSNSCAIILNHFSNHLK